LCLLSGCISSIGTGQVNEDITILRDQLSINILQSDDYLPIIEPDSKRADVTFSVTFMAIESGEELAVAFTSIDKPMDNDIVFPTYHYLCTLAQGEKVLQSFEIESSECIIDPTYIDFIDMDFDGYLDMSVVWFKGASNRIWEYYRYDANKNTFEETPFFRAWGLGVEMFPDTQQIILTGGTGGFYEREMYQYFNSSYSLLRREYAEWDDYNSRTYNLHIEQYDGEDNVTDIFSTTLTEDEYYGDFSIRDNYLRFGKNSK